MTLNTASHSLQFVKVNDLVGPDNCIFGDVTGVDSPVTAPSGSVHRNVHFKPFHLDQERESFP